MADRADKMARIAKKKYVTVAAIQWLNIRREPSLSAPIVGKFLPGEKVEIDDREAPEGWIAVKGGYVMEKFTK